MCSDNQSLTKLWSSKYYRKTCQTWEGSWERNTIFLFPQTNPLHPRALQRWPRAQLCVLNSDGGHRRMMEARRWLTTLWSDSRWEGTPGRKSGRSPALQATGIQMWSMAANTVTASGPWLQRGRATPWRRIKCKPANYVSPRAACKKKCVVSVCAKNRRTH